VFLYNNGQVHSLPIEKQKMNLIEILKRKSPLLLDGAMGTQLADFGLEMSGRNNLSHPEAVLSIHRRYVECGSDILTTNTLTMNRIFIESHALLIDVREVNIAGAKLARSAATPDRYVLGDMSSTGQMLEPYGKYAESQFFETFKEQAEYLVEGGVDGFIVETMVDLREALCAVRACRAVASLPILASLAFRTTRKEGRTIMGNGAEESAVALMDAGASAVGANCGDLDPVQMAIIVAIIKQAVSAPILAQPNAGHPRLVNGRTVFNMLPEEFARGIEACIRSGASLVGGCCGTTPAHIQRVAELVNRTRHDVITREGVKSSF
jgi:5-methyltetrahydrofolate--homocysteine methyltransferase